MKKICLLLLSLVFSLTLVAQDITLTFTGKTSDNGYVKLSKVVISNLTKDWEEIINYPDTTYTFKTDGVSDYENNQKLLFQNMPNPFDGETDVTIQMTETENVSMNVFDVNGKMVLNHSQTLTPGNHTFHLHLASAQTYIFTVKSKGRQASIKMLNLKSGGKNGIEYVGADDHLKYTLKSINNENPFDKGDDMSYMGYTNANGKELQSNLVTKKLSESETIDLIFSIPEPKVITNDVTGVTYTSATFNGEVVPLMPLVKCGFCYGLTRTPDIQRDSVVYVETADSIFTATVSNLLEGTTYAVRAFAVTSNDKVFYGDVKAFNTPKKGDMVIYTSPVTEIDFTTVVTGGVVAETGGNTILAYGVCYGAMENPTVSNNMVNAELAGDTFVVKLSDLYPGTKYHVRAYAYSEKGFFYGQDIAFTTKEAVIPTIVTSEVTAISSNSAVCGGTLTDDGHSQVTKLGICWSTQQNPEVKDSVMYATTGKTTFSLLMKSLKAATTYYVRAFAENEKGISYGEQREFTTITEAFASVVTDSVSRIYRKTATCGGEVLDDAGFAVTARGLCWSTKENPTIEDSITVEGAGLGKFTSVMTGLQDTTTYYVRAYATNEKGTAYGIQREFRTLSMSAPIILNFQEPYNIKTTSVEVYATVSYQEQDEMPFDHGFVIDTVPNVTLETGTRYWAAFSLSNNSVTSIITDLKPGTTYYINAFAKNKAGVSYYKEERTFTTMTCEKPELVTPHPYSIETISAAVRVSVTLNEAGGVQHLDTLGWILSSVGDPLEDTNAVVDVRGESVFLRDGIYIQNYRIDNLKANTTYYMRLFAVTECAKAYGQIDTFKTQAIELATVEIDTIIDVLSHVATCKARITSVANGYFDKNKVGLCYGKQENPEIGQEGVATLKEYYFGTTTLEHTFQLTGLEQATTYYVRAYAKNEAGMTYSPQASFTTLNLETATVLTVPASGISPISANIGGHVTYDGGTTVTQRGICYATHENPVIEKDSMTKDGEGLGFFPTILKGLTPATTYYYRAYAVNIEGVAYSEGLSFTTAEETGGEFVCGKSLLEDIDGNKYPTAQYGSQCWMTQNLRATKYSDGTGIEYRISKSATDSDPINTPKPKYYDPDKTNHAEIFGYMYNYSAILNGSEPSSSNPSGVQGPCPEGWHVPSVAEFNQLFEYVKSNLCTKSCPNSVAQSLASNLYWYQGTGLNAPKECTPSYEQETTNNESGFNVFPLDVLLGAAKNFDGQSAYLATTDRTYKNATTPQNMYKAIMFSFSTSGNPSTNNPNFYRQTPIRCVKD